MTTATKPAAGGPPGRGASFGLAGTILAVPTGVALINPGLAAILASAELTLLLTVLLTAVFGPAPTSERAFRLLRWMTGRPEPLQTTNLDQTWRTHDRDLLDQRSIEPTNGAADGLAGADSGGAPRCR